MRKIYKLEHHAKPQFYGLEGIKLDMIIDLKDLNKMLPIIHKNLGIEESITYDKMMGPLLHSNDNGKKISNKTIYDPTFKKNVATKKPKTFTRIPSFTYFYDNESINIIQKIYQKDFEHFGYSLKLGDNNNTCCSDPKTHSCCSDPKTHSCCSDPKTHSSCSGPKTVSIFKI
jgi:hypothetical protein